MDALGFLEDVAGYVRAQRQQEERGQSPKLATVDDSYTPADFYSGTLPKVTFDGESVLTTKRYPVMSPYEPQPSDRVVMLPVGHTYVIMGSLSTARPARRRVATATVESDSAAIGAAVRLQVASVTAALQSGSRYLVWFDAGFRADSAGDSVQAIIQEDDTDGTELQLRNLGLPESTNSSGFGVYAAAEYEAVATGNKTFVAVGRGFTANSDDVFLEASATAPTYMCVDRIE